MSTGKVLSVHARVCNTVADGGAAIALVAPEVGDGPLNVVLADWAGALSGVHVGMPVAYRPDRLVLDSLVIDLAAARTWAACPDWEKLRRRRAAIEAALKRLTALCWEHNLDNPLGAVLGAPSPGDGRAALLAARFGEAAQCLKAGWEGDARALAEGGAALAGLGEGLTPAGDDFLAGVMLWAWLAHPDPKAFCRALAEAAAPRTTTLSAAFLRAAARGQCSAAWHGLLAALSAQVPGTFSWPEPEGRPEGRSIEDDIDGARAWHLERAARRVLAYGASSGVDALVGFLYLSTGAEQVRQSGIGASGSPRLVEEKEDRCWSRL